MSKKSTKRDLMSKKSTKRDPKNKKPIFPFTAIIGQVEMKIALILNLIDPRIGGVIAMGDRGTGKSTTIRAIADLLPDIEVVAENAFNSSLTDFDLMSEDVEDIILNGGDLKTAYRKVPMIDLPLGATEDRVCGTIDIERALNDGIKAFEPGLLAKANRGILYVDEVNLLDDHLVDILLDSAASGWNTVEREGMSVRHPARFVLVGSGNPEEGELRPQLLDRFGLYAEIKTVRDPRDRVAVVDERSAFDLNPEETLKDWKEQQNILKRRIIRSQERLPSVSIPYELRLKISEVCARLNIDGLRGDIVINRAAKAFAAFLNHSEVTEIEIMEVALLCLRHRLRKNPLEAIDSGEKVKAVFAEVFGIPAQDLDLAKYDEEERLDLFSEIFREKGICFI